MPFEVSCLTICEGVARERSSRWLVSRAMRERGPPLVEVMTDKASVEIPSPSHGNFVALHAEEGQVVPSARP